MLQNLFSRFKKEEAILHDLRYLFWECTLRCTLNCLHCGSDCHQDARQPDMPAADFLRVLKSVKEREDPSKIMIVITGGEPLLRNDLVTCVHKRNIDELPALMEFLTERETGSNPIWILNLAVKLMWDLMKMRSEMDSSFVVQE